MACGIPLQPLADRVKAPGVSPARYVVSHNVDPHSNRARPGSHSKRLSRSKTQRFAKDAATSMFTTVNREGPTRWTLEERAREERARAVRARHDQQKTPEQRLEETLRLSRLIGELRDGATPDVSGR